MLADFAILVALILIFSVGSVAVIASIVRITALYRYNTAAKTMGDVPCAYPFPCAR